MNEVIAIIGHELERFGLYPGFIGTTCPFPYTGLHYQKYHLISGERSVTYWYDDNGYITLSLRVIGFNDRKAIYNPAHPNFNPHTSATLIKDFLAGDNTEYGQMQTSRQL